jgi:hypothetical protein
MCRIGEVAWLAVLLNLATNKVLANVENVSAVTTAVRAVKLVSPSSAPTQPVGARSLASTR